MFDFKGKNVLILGLGKSGLAAFDALMHSVESMAVYDERDIEWEDEKSYARFVALGIRMFFNGKPVPDDNWDVVIMSPGVPTDAPYVKAARKKGAKIIGELELAYMLGKGRYIAITGTNGKTTTTTLVGEIFRLSSMDSAVVGNIGTPVIKKSLKSNDDTWLVTEVSSFQLETIDTFRPDIATFLNLTPDHLDRHKTVENYGKAKAKVFMNQRGQDFAIYNADDEKVTEYAQKSKAKKIPFSTEIELEEGVYLKDGKIIIADKEKDLIEVIDSKDMQIYGKHNLSNALAATAIAYAADIPIELITKALRMFKGVEHRLEPVTTIRDVKFINDSKGTNPDAAIKAIEAVGDNIILIAGGYDKEADFDEFIKACKGRVKCFMLIGQTAEKIKAAAKKAGMKEVYIVQDLGEATRLGFELSSPGDSILLSPACASWDMFTSFEDRGEKFKKRVEELRRRD